MDLYNGKINEFVDWVSGRDSFTGQDVTGGLSVSGGSIRQLLQDKLKKPFYMHEDTAANKYRMFSSEEAYMAWSENPTDNLDLELFNFVRPSDYKLDLTATDSDGFNNKFVRYGDTNSNGTRIAFQWSIYNDEGESSDSLSVTYTIASTETGSSTTFTRWYNRSDANPNFSIYEYLQPGENVVTIEAKGSSTGARNTKTFTIIMLQINLTSSFKFYEKCVPNTPIQVPYSFERNNISGTAKIYFRVDDGGTGKLYSRDIVQGGPAKTTDTLMIMAELSEGTHTLQVWAEAKYNDGNTTVNSNLLFYTFTIASSVVGSTGKFINIATSFDSGDFPLSDLMLTATQYESSQLQWGYYTDSLQTNTSISVTWKLLDGLDDANPTVLGTMTANSQQKATNLSYIPTIYTEDGHSTYLAAYYGNTMIDKFPVYIVRNTKVVVNETGFYEVKMSAYGKTNDSPTKNTWTDTYQNVTTTFTNIQWNVNSGWYNNSFRTVGVNEYATIDAQPFSTFDFSTGKTIEIEFESEKVTNESDIIITIGNPRGARIEITPDTATLFDNGNQEVVHTNYKSNERLKLAFIINSFPEEQALRTVESGLAYIVNNGILERAATASGRSFNTEGTIKIGGATSGVRVYNLRVYNYAISYSDAYNNFLFDSEDKASVANRNNILDASNNISFDLCKNKLDTILISGDLSNILSGKSDKDGSTTDVTIERFCPSDSSKNFKINNVLIRKHGQSTLNYPITSMKFWLNKSKSGIVPVYESTQQQGLFLNKNRYVMKSADDQGKPSIPANKFVLQANYADSSGVHNGGLERLIQYTWFNARIDGEYKLRTEPQLFTTSELVHHNDQQLHEDGSIEGYSNVTGKSGMLWRDVTNAEFPYDIRISPDSFPCAVFYYDENGTKARTFLGQYVFMDDKKSDFCYGERSIYSIPFDPFCLTNAHKDDDTDANLVWDNKNVLRVEVVGSNVPFTSYMTHDHFTDIVTVEETDSQGEPTGNTHRSYNWEQGFEMIYPDEDDIAKDDAKAGIDKFNPNSKYVRKIQPFIDFHEWVVSTRNNQAKFEAEAAQHLDLYKMAAYYIFVVRFGLVDSLERNAQIKTYDGVHFHYEPWDMDIALGNKNDGGIAYAPPINRDTKLPGSVSTYAISGRSADAQGNVVTSNWLFDALEAWGYWANTIVRKVADALWLAGLTYDNIQHMFDDNYASKWCEIMYNESGFFKYVESGNGDPTWLSWLQGSRMTHRHWWLSTSMDYYDAKWFCGDYKKHNIYIRANVTEGSNQYIRITPNKLTYMSVVKDDDLKTTASVDRNNPLEFNMTIGSNTKNPILIYGANFMEEIDLSEIAHGLDGISLGGENDGVYSEVLGSPLKRLNLGVQITPSGADYTATLASLGCQIQGHANVFKSLQSLNIRGQLNQTDLNSLVHNNNISELQEVLAMGSGLTNFYSSESGNSFTNIELPDTVYTVWMNNSTWQQMTFWHATTDSNNNATLSQLTGIPTTVHNVSLLGTTGSSLSSIQFVRSWLANLAAANADLSQYNLIMDKINWSDTTVGASNLLTYEELAQIAQLGNQTSLKGYLVLRDTGEELTSAQLNMIKSWFGDTVFTKNSSGLVVDHKRNYVQINIGGNVTVDEHGEVTLVEGNSASLNATRFSLAEDESTDYMWSVGPVGSNDSSGRYNGLSVIQASESLDGLAYIQSSQSTVGHNYDAKIYTAVAGQPYSTTIHVIAASYPNDLHIASKPEGNISLRTAPGYTEFPATYASASFYITSDQEYTGVIRSTTYTLTRLSDNASVSFTTGEDGSSLTSFSDPYMKLAKSTTTSGIKITVDSAMPEDTKFYILTAKAVFTSGYEQTSTINIVVQQDSDIIVPASKASMFNPLNTTWETQFGSPIGKNNMYKVDLLAITGTVDFSPYASELPNLLTYINTSLLDYLPNCLGIILDGCTLVPSEVQSLVGSDKNHMKFSKMKALRTLSIDGCTGLTEDIDLTSCPYITQVDASGTSINVFVPENPILTKYELGVPTEVSLINPTLLSPDNVVVDNYINLDSLDITNVYENKSFTMFNKITANYMFGDILFGKTIEWANNTYNVVDDLDSNLFAIPDINVSGGEIMKLEFNGSGIVNVYQFDQNHSYISVTSVSSGGTIHLNSNTKFINVANSGGRFLLHYMTITDTTNDVVLFKYSG